MTNKSARERLAECRKADRTCEVSDCYFPTQKWGRLCDSHDKTEERTGHPDGRTIRVAELQPFIDLTRRYIKKHAEHPQIAEELRWLYDLIHGPRQRIEFLPRGATPKQRLSRWLDRLADQNVHEVDALAMLVALYQFRETYPRDFKSDRHFRHQLVIRLLRMVRAPRLEAWGGGKAIYRYDRITVAVREALGERIESRLGLLCLRIARLLTPTLKQGNQDI